MGKNPLRGSKALWLPVTLVCAVLLVGALLVTSIYLNLRQQSLRGREQLLLALARSSASNLQNYLASYQKDFSVIKSSSDFQAGVAAFRESGDDSLLLDYLDTYNYATEDYVADIFLTDHQRTVLTGTSRWTGLYRLVFLLFAAVGSVSDVGAVWQVADICNGMMALPNLIALLLLSPEAFRLLRAWTADKR